MNSYTTVQKDQLGKIGAHLKENREQQEKTIEDISLQTYIRPQLIRAIESGNTEDLPQPIFVQGFIRRYAEALGLEGLSISKQFPVHSIPDTPRPNPQPAAKPSMFSSAAMANPVVTAPKPVPRQPPQTTTVATPKPISPTRPLPVEPSHPVEAPQPKPSAVARSVTIETPTSLPSKSPIIQPVEPAATWPPAQSPPTQMSTGNAMPYILAGVLAALVVGAIALISNLSSGRDSQEATPPPAEPPAAVATAPVATPPPEPEPTAISEAPVYLQVEVTEAGPSWMQINVDGKVAYEGMINAGEKKLWEGQNRISMNVGNAGAALVSVNGSDPKPAGNPGAATVLTFTPDSP